MVKSQIGCDLKHYKYSPVKIIKGKCIKGKNKDKLYNDNCPLGYYWRKGFYSPRVCEKLEDPIDIKNNAKEYEKKVKEEEKFLNGLKEGLLFNKYLIDYKRMINGEEYTSSGKLFSDFYKENLKMELHKELKKYDILKIKKEVDIHMFDYFLFETFVHLGEGSYIMLYEKILEFKDEFKKYGYYLIATPKIEKPKSKSVNKSNKRKSVNKNKKRKSKSIRRKSVNKSNKRKSKSIRRKSIRKQRVRKPCEGGDKNRSPKTNRCLKPCKEGKIRNKETNRCK